MIEQDSIGKVEVTIIQKELHYVDIEEVCRYKEVFSSIVDAKKWLVEHDFVFGLRGFEDEEQKEGLWWHRDDTIYDFKDVEIGIVQSSNAERQKEELNWWEIL